MMSGLFSDTSALTIFLLSIDPRLNFMVSPQCTVMHMLVTTHILKNKKGGCQQGYENLLSQSSLLLTCSL